MSLRVNGGDVVGIAAVDDAPLFVLMVRSALKGKVKTIADLKGKVHSESIPAPTIAKPPLSSSSELPAQVRRSPQG